MMQTVRLTLDVEGKYSCSLKRPPSAPSCINTKYSRISGTYSDDPHLSSITSHHAQLFSQRFISQIKFLLSRFPKEPKTLDELLAHKEGILIQDKGRPTFSFTT